VVACLCWQERYEVFNICFPLFCNFDSFVTDIEIKVQDIKFSHFSFFFSFFGQTLTSISFLKFPLIWRVN
jgi:hypothetical protein